MARFRLHRGIDARNVASAQECALATSRPGFRLFVVSGTTPFDQHDVVAPKLDAASDLTTRAPEFVAGFSQRNWPLPRTIDRVLFA